MKDNVVHDFMERRAEEMGLSLEPEEQEEEAERWVGEPSPEYYALLRAIGAQWVSHYAGPGAVRISFRPLAVKPWFIVLRETMADRKGWGNVVAAAMRRYKFVGELADQHRDRKPPEMSEAIWRGVVAMSLRGIVRDISSGA